MKTQLIAHDKEVYDIAFARGKDIFASVGADGSVRLFDLRTLEHSTIIYETSSLRPLLRLAWNKQDPNYLATVLADDPRTVVLDVRVPSIPVAELGAHQASVNSVAWAPHSSCHLCTCSDDCQALIWDLTALPKPVDDPILAYTADAEVNQLQWSTAHQEWVAIAYATTVVQALHYNIVKPGEGVAAGPGKRGVARSTSRWFRRSSGGINLSRSRMWREIRSNKRAPAVRGPRGACVPVKRRNRPRNRAASPSKPSPSPLSESPLACTASTAALRSASASRTSPVVTSVQTAKPSPQATAHRNPRVETQPPRPANKNWFRVAWHLLLHVLLV